MGGEARVILKIDPTLNEQWFGRPFFLPDGQTVLFAVERIDDSTAVVAAQRYDIQEPGDGEAIRNNDYVSQDIVAYSPATGRRILNMPTDYVRGIESYSPTGHLLYRNLFPSSHQYMLWTVAFDLETLTLTDDPFLVTPNGIGGNAYSGHRCTGFTRQWIISGTYT